MRYLPSLGKKPVPASGEREGGGAGREGDRGAREKQKKERFDPFADPPAELRVAELYASALYPRGGESREGETTEEEVQAQEAAGGPAEEVEEPSHVLVLNKFPVIPAHFILATKRDAPQSDLLEEGDVWAAWACVRAYEEGSSAVFSRRGGSSGDGHEDEGERGREGDDAATTQTPRRLFAFFNSGPHSGASQPHRHIQFLPLDSPGPPPSSTPAEEPWTLLPDGLFPTPAAATATAAATPLRNRALPLAHFALPIPAHATPAALHAVYTALYRAALAHARVWDARLGGVEDGVVLRSGGAAAAEVSYNLAMTGRVMVVAPRRREGVRLEGGGVVAVNGTVLGGSLMVKGREEWDILRGEGGGEVLERVLGGIGVPWLDGEGEEDGDVESKM